MDRSSSGVARASRSLMSVGKPRHDFSFTLLFHRLENFADPVGDVVVVWERAKAVKATKPLAASPGSRTLVFSEKDELTGVVQMIKEGKERYQEKEYKISLRQSNAKGKSLAHVYVDFAKFVTPSGTKRQLVDLTLSNGAVIIVLFTSKFKGRAKAKNVQPEQHVPPPEDDLQGLVDDDEVWNQEDDFENEIEKKKKLNVDKDEETSASKRDDVGQGEESNNTPQPNTIQVTDADSVELKLEDDAEALAKNSPSEKVPAIKRAGEKPKLVQRAQSARTVQRVNHAGRNIQRAPSASIARSNTPRHGNTPKDEPETGATTSVAVATTAAEQPAARKLLRQDSGKLVRMPSGKIVRVKRAGSSKSVRPARSGSVRKNQIRNDSTISSDNLAVPASTQVPVPALTSAPAPAPEPIPESASEPIEKPMPQSEPTAASNPTPGSDAKLKPKKKALVRGNKNVLARTPAHSGHLSMDIPILPFESGDFHNIPTFNGIDGDEESTKATQGKHNSSASRPRIPKTVQGKTASSSSLPRVPAAASSAAVQPRVPDRTRSASRSRLQRGSSSIGAGPASAGRALPNNLSHTSSVTEDEEDNRKLGMGKRTQSERGRGNTGTEWLRKRNATLRAENEELKARVRELELFKQTAIGAETGELLLENEALQAEVDELKLKLTREPVYTDVLLELKQAKMALALMHQYEQDEE